MEERSKIFFVKDGKRIPFSDFLKAQRAHIGSTWDEMDELLGVRRLEAYALKVSNGRPNNPPREVFLKIISELGFREGDFEVEDLRDRDLKEKQRRYESALRQIGDMLLQINAQRAQEGQQPQMLSCSAIRKILGEGTFYQVYGRTYKQRQKLHKDMLSLDPRYSEIKLQHQVQDRGDSSSLRDFEEDIILREMQAYIEKEGTRTNGELPGGVFGHIMERLNEERKRRGLQERTKESVIYHTTTLRHGSIRPKPIEFIRGSPQEKDPVDIALEERLNEVQSPETEKELEGIIEKDEGNKRRNEFRKYSSPEHKRFLFFLTHSENYKRFIGNDLDLIKVDFPQEEECPKLYKAHKDLIERLGEKLSEKDRDLTEFAYEWQRADMVFKRADGTYVVVEVKPNALKENGRKGSQQVASYTAIMLDNLERKNEEGFGNPDYTPLKEDVEGYLAVHRVDDSIKRHLIRKAGRRVIEISKEEVDNYIDRILGEKIKEHSEKVSRHQKEHEKRERDWHELQQIMAAVPEGAINSGCPAEFVLTPERKRGEKRLRYILRYEGEPGARVIIGAYMLNKDPGREFAVEEWIENGKISVTNNKYFFKKPGVLEVIRRAIRL